MIRPILQLALVFLLAGCHEVVPGPQATLDAPTLATAVDETNGWTLSTGAKFQLQFTAVSNAVFWCRSYWQGGTPPAYAHCDRAAGISPIHAPTASFGHSNGTYQTDVYYTKDSETSHVLSVTYYMHNSLNGLARCSASATLAQFATAAAPLLTIGNFPDNNQLTTPFVHLEVSSATHPLDDAKLLNADLISLRHRFTLTSAGGKSMIVMTRAYPSKHYGTCSNKIAVGKVRAAHSHYQRLACDALAFDAAATLVCLQVSSGTITPTLLSHGALSTMGLNASSPYFAAALHRHGLFSAKTSDSVPYSFGETDSLKFLPLNVPK